MAVALAVQEQPQEDELLTAFVDLLDGLRRATSLVEVNVAAGLAYEAVRQLSD